MSFSVSTVLSDIQVQDGVFYPDTGSVALAEVALQMNGDFLEIGTGSGFLSILLKVHGKNVIATDISEASVACARRNAAKYGIELQVICSDLFSGVTGQFDVIVFNPPSNATETENDRRRKNSIKRTIPAFIWKPLSFAFQKMNTSHRRSFLESFVKQSQNYLRKGGVVLLNIAKADWEYMQGFSVNGMTAEKLNSSHGCVVIRFSVGDAHI